MKKGFQITIIFLSSILIVLYLKGFNQRAYKDTVRSDGRGYYAYLPAIFLFQDPSYQKVEQAENLHENWKGMATYLNGVEGERVVNKYFPGTALLQVPFFMIGALFAWIFGFPVDGYSFPFLLLLNVASWFYTLLALWLAVLVIRLRGCTKGRVHLIVVLLVLFLTPVYYYTTNYPSLSHIYSFFLFSLFIYLLSHEKLNWSIISIVVALILLVRPPNVLILLFIPYLIGMDKMKEALVDWRHTTIRVLPGLILLLVYPILVFWQTGRFAQWSYTGEGFIWGFDHWWDFYFSYRNGLFLHNPIYLISLITGLVLLKRNWFWLFALSATGFVFSCWWCWDYESLFGLRPMTEFALLLLMPLIDAWSKFSRRRKYLLLVLIGLASIFQWSRFQLLVNGMYNQRFTANTYWASLWNYEEGSRFQFYRSCPPKGNVMIDTCFFRQLDSSFIGPDADFALSNMLSLPEKQKGEMEYLDVSLEKFQLTDTIEEAFLVIDATPIGKGAGIYHVYHLYEDRLKDKGKWKELCFQYVFHDKSTSFNQVKVYIWNPGKCSFALRNVRYSWKRYGE